MSDVHLDMSEVHALAMDIEAAADRVERQAPQAVRHGAQVVHDFAVQAVPVDTGELLNSIEVVENGLEATVEATADHAIYVEFGTSRTQPQPFMFPASDRGEEALADALEDLVDDL